MKESRWALTGSATLRSLTILHLLLQLSFLSRLIG